MSGASVHGAARPRFAREVERIRQHLRLLSDRGLLAESYARESSVVFRDPRTVQPGLALEDDPVVVAYALRWLEVGEAGGLERRDATWADASPAASDG